MARAAIKARTRQPPPRRARDKTDEVRTKILRAFSDRAKRSGIRSVVMGDLASELRMSISTLYDHFPSKEQLVAAMVEHWCTDLATHDALTEAARRPVLERFNIWAEAWSSRIIQYSPAFWSDLARDYPSLWTRLQRDLDARKAQGVALLQPYLRPGLVPAAAFSLLEMIYARSHDPRLCDRLGIARRDAVLTALSIWAAGALEPSVSARKRRPR